MRFPRSPLARHRLLFRLLLLTALAVCGSSLVVAGVNIHWAWQLSHATEELRLAQWLLHKTATQLSSVEVGTMLQTQLAEEQRNTVSQLAGALGGRIDDVSTTVNESLRRVRWLQCQASGGKEGCPEAETEGAAQ